MISLLQKFYSIVFDPFAGLMQKTGEKFNNGVIFFCTFLISSYYVIGSERSVIPYIEGSLARIHLICSFILFILIIFSVRDKLKPVRWNRFLFCLMFFAGLGMLIASLFHRVGSGYRAFSMLLMFGFPALYYVWNNRADYNTLFQSFSVSFIITGLFIYCFFIYLSVCGRLDMPEGRVSPNMHANLFSMFGMVMIISATYLLFLKGPCIRWMIICSLSFGAGLDMVLLSQSRSCLLVLFGDILCALFFFIKLKRTGTARFCIKDLLILLLFTVVFIVFFRFAGTYAVAINSSVKDGAGSTIESIVDSSAGSTDDADVSDRLSTENKTLDGYSSGRITAWKWYYSHLNLLGNDVYDVSYSDETGIPLASAHNTIIDYAFRFGIPVSILHLLLEISVGCLALRVLFSKRYTDPVFLFIALAVMTYAVQSMVEIALLPFDRQSVLLYYLAVMPLLDMSFSSAGAQKEPQ